MKNQIHLLAQIALLQSRRLRGLEIQVEKLTGIVAKGTGVEIAALANGEQLEAALAEETSQIEAVLREIESGAG